MRNSTLLAISMMFCCAPAFAAAKDGEPVSLRLSWRVSLDAQGHVTQLQAKPDKRVERMTAVRDSVEKKIRSWQFTPGAVNGVPQATETNLVVTTTLLPRSGDDYEIRIDEARTGAEIAKVQVPRYPQGAARNGTSGLVVLRIEFDADGKVTSALADKDETKAAAALIKASLDAVKTWTFQPERVAGRGVAGTTELPMCFQVVPLVGLRAPEVPRCEWKPKGYRGALAQGEALAIDPVAKLATDVVDHTL